MVYSFDDLCRDDGTRQRKSICDCIVIFKYALNYADSPSFSSYRRHIGTQFDFNILFRDCVVAAISNQLYVSSSTLHSVFTFR